MLIDASLSLTSAVYDFETQCWLADVGGVGPTPIGKGLCKKGSPTAGRREAENSIV